jgi:tetraacyldisaccharide 4'-kinase
MNYEQSHRRLISGRSTGLGAGLLRFVLGIAASGYWLVVRLRNFLYSQGWLKVHHVDAAVICVGNLTTGGTGKTPLVIWAYEKIISNFKSQISDTQIAILTRGYKAVKDAGLKTRCYSDEIAVLTESCPEAEVVVDPDRVAGAAKAINAFGAKVMIMDDGFQHRRLARDLDIVAIDATRPFGYGKMLPAGLLREPVTSLKRADAVVMTRCDQVDMDDLDELEKKLRSIRPDIVLVRSIHTPICARSAKQDTITIEQLRGKKVFAFCGIGNPEAFLGTIRNLGCKPVGSKVFDDHHHYTKDCLSGIFHEADHLGADLILTTQKDWTKLVSGFKSQMSDSAPPVPLAYLAIEIEFLDGERQLTALIEDVLAGRISKKQK